MLLSLHQKLEVAQKVLDDEIAVSSFSPLSQLASWIDAFSKGANYTTSNDQYNMPVVAVYNGLLSEIAQSDSSSSSTPSQFEPMFQIGDGEDFDTFATQWMNSFPKDYPRNRVAFENGCQKFILKIDDASNKAWHDFGYTETTTTHSEDFLFWSHNVTEVNRSEHDNITTTTQDFTGDVEMRAWQYKRFPVTYGQYVLRPV